MDRFDNWQSCLWGGRGVALRVLLEGIVFWDFFWINDDIEQVFILTLLVCIHLQEWLSHYG